MKHVRFFLLAALFVIAGALRLYRFSSPVADWHSWRQADTAAVAQNFLKFGVDPLHPRYDDLSNIQSGKDNPMGYRMVEFPLYQLMGVGIVKLIPTLSAVSALRIVSILFSSLTAVMLVLLVIPLGGMAAGGFAGLLYAILPYSVFYGRSLLPETPAVFFAVASLLFLHLIHEHKGKRLLLICASLCAAAALLIKPTAGFLLLPAFYLLFRSFGLSLHLFIGLFVYWFIGLFPLWWWRQWILQFPEGIPVYVWLLNGNGIRFKGAWFQWLFAKRIGELILGYWGLIPFGMGVVALNKKTGWFLGLLGVGALAYMSIFATGNVQHDYYQIVLLPVLAAFTGIGLATIVQGREFSRVARYTVALVSVGFMLMFSWYTIRTYYWINRQDLVEAGQAADKLLPADAKVIAPNNGDTTFLFLINRQGWPLGFDIEKHRQMGATHYVTVSPTDADWETRDLANMYTVLVRNEKFAIIDLTKPKK